METQGRPQNCNFVCVYPPGLALFGWVRLHGMGWTPGAALRVCSRRAPPHPLSQAGARVTVPRLRSGKFDCSWHSAMPLVLHFALSRFHSTRFVFVASCGRCLSFGALGLLLARWCLSFFFGGSAPSVLLLFLLAAAVDFCPLMLVAAVGVPLLAPCGFCPPWGVFLLVVVSGVCCLVLWASWGFCRPWAVSVRFRCCDWR